VAKSKLSDKIFHDEDAARAHFEALRWPDGRVCPHCGTVGNSVLLKGKSTRPGLYKCRDCRKPFTATLGTIYERSHIPLHKWLLATHLMCASKKGMSAKQLHRMLGFGSYRTAWFMAHRIREAMAPLKGSTDPLGGEGKIVEADETYIGGKDKNKHKSKRPNKGRGGVSKEIVVSLVERNGAVRSFHVANVSGKTLRPILVTQIDRASTLMTDEGGQYATFGKEFARHETVNHGIGEYVRGPFHSNTVEGYFSLLKRGVIGTYHSISEAHLRRYLAEFDFRYNHREALGINDTERTDAAIAGTVGKRLTYRQPLQA
jgi:transposase-like protein